MQCLRPSLIFLATFLYKPLTRSGSMLLVRIQIRQINSNNGRIRIRNNVNTDRIIARSGSAKIWSQVRNPLTSPLVLKSLAGCKMEAVLHISAAKLANYFKIYWQILAVGCHWNWWIFLQIEAIFATPKHEHWTAFSRIQAYGCYNTLGDSTIMFL